MIIYADLRRVPIFRNCFKNSGVIQQNQYKNFFTYYAIKGKLIRKLPSGLFFSHPRFRDGDDKIIIFDSYTNTRMLNWICKKEPDKRIIYWCWNMIGKDDWFRGFPEKVEKWSYSLTDCRKYGIRHNTQFYFDCFEDEAERCRNLPVSYPPKVLFIGRDKGRTAVLEDMKSEIEKTGAEVELDIAERDIMIKEKLVPYEQVVERVKKADVLLDYNNTEEAGLSLRCMESLFFGKKLITNNREILESDFYDPANIYVLGYDTRTYDEFFRTETVPADTEICERYLLSNWIKRFDGEGKII